MSRAGAQAFVFSLAAGAVVAVLVGAVAVGSLLSATALASALLARRDWRRAAR